MGCLLCRSVFCCYICSLHCLSIVCECTQLQKEAQLRWDFVCPLSIWDVSLSNRELCAITCLRYIRWASSINVRSNVIEIGLSSLSVCVIATSLLRRSWCMMSYRSSLHLACLLMMGANMWRDLDTVNLFTYDVGSIFCATRWWRLELAVSNVLVLHLGGASSLRAQSVIGVKLSSFRMVSLLPVQC